MRPKLVLSIVLLAAVAGWFAWQASRSDRLPAGDSETSATGAAGGVDAAGGVGVAALGRLEPEAGVIQVGALPGERLGQVLVRVGDDVAEGAELAYLGSRPLRQAQRDLARIQLEDAQARLKAEKIVAATVIAEAQVVVEQSRLQVLDINNQEAQVGLAQANLDQVQKELARLEGLSSDLVPAQELEQKKLLERQAREEVRVATTLLDKLRATAVLAEKAAEAKLDAARANAQLLDASGAIASMEESLRLAQTNLDQTVIRAPLAGRILDLLTRPGEMIGQAPILQMADVNRMQVVAEVYETDVRHVRIGQKVVATSRALSAPLSGKVVEIGSIVSQNEVQSLTAATSSAQRVVKVRIDLDDSAAAARLIHLQVDVQFLTSGDTAAAATRRQ